MVWPLYHLTFKFLNLSIMLTCHVKCSLHELLCIRDVDYVMECDNGLL